MGDELQPPLGPVTTDNLSEHIKRLDTMDPAAQTGQPTPTEKKEVAAAASPVAAATTDEPTPEDWFEKVKPETSHAWLTKLDGKGVDKAFRSAQLKIQEQGNRLRELERRGSEAAPAAPQAAAAPAPPTSVAHDDPRRAEYATALYVNPDRARDIMLEWIDERTDARMAARESGREADQHQSAAVNAGQSVVQKLVASGIDQQTAERRIIRAVAPEMELRAQQVYADHGGSDNPQATTAWRKYWQDPKNYEDVYADIYGPVAQTAAIAVPSSTPRAEPPGSKTSAAPVTRKVDTKPSLGQDDMRMLAGMAEAAGVKNVDEVAERIAARR